MPLWMLIHSTFRKTRRHCAKRYAQSRTLANQTNYRTSTPLVHPTFAVVPLFEIKLTLGKLVTSSFQHMDAICGARKSFLFFICRIRCPLELIDLHKEIFKGALHRFEYWSSEMLISACIR
jgi:hypothetical protein